MQPNTKTCLNSQVINPSKLLIIIVAIYLPASKQRQSICGFVNGQILFFSSWYLTRYKIFSRLSVITNYLDLSSRSPMAMAAANMNMDHVQDLVPFCNICMGTDFN